MQVAGFVASPLRLLEVSGKQVARSVLYHYVVVEVIPPMLGSVPWFARLHSCAFAFYSGVIFPLRTKDFKFKFTSKSI